MRKYVLPCLAALVLLFGLSLLLYPTVNGWRLGKEASHAADVFRESIAAPTESPAPDDNPMASPAPTPMPYPELYDAMLAYNEDLFADGQSKLTSLADCEAAGFDPTAFGFSGDVVALLSIPRLELEMPVYLGATCDNMAAGCAVLGQTSLPVGGANTNCVIAGHRGWNGAAYFQFLDELEVGDEVSITNPWETLTYTVAETRVIDPTEIRSILIQPGRELLTLLTCHPYASGGKYRLLVYCERQN